MFDDVPENRHVRGGVRILNSRVILVHDDISDVVQPVFDVPVSPDSVYEELCEILFNTTYVITDACMCFFRSFKKTPDAYDPADSRPVSRYVGRRIRHGNLPNFKASPVLFATSRRHPWERRFRISDELIREVLADCL